jgi:hypothetical protein
VTPLAVRSQNGTSVGIDIHRVRCIHRKNRTDAERRDNAK